eukprot:COSAG02_NODE_615_length_19511_cov_64.132701_12_plen_52_part_00
MTTVDRGQVHYLGYTAIRNLDRHLDEMISAVGDAAACHRRVVSTTSVIIDV